MQRAVALTRGLDAADAVPLIRDANDEAAAAVAAAPDRLQAMATLPFADPHQVAVELERATRLGLVGVTLHGRTGGVLIDDPRFEENRTLAERDRYPASRRRGPRLASRRSWE